MLEWNSSIETMFLCVLMIHNINSVNVKHSYNTFFLKNFRSDIKKKE